MQENQTTNIQLHYSQDPAVYNEVEFLTDTPISAIFHLGNSINHLLNTMIYVFSIYVSDCEVYLQPENKTKIYFLKLNSLIRLY